jgi:L-fucose mutarotase
MVLKGIPPILSPDLLHVLASMGHGDMLVLADSNFPSASISAKGPRLARADGHPITQLLEAILQLFPLDTQHSSPVGHSL